jgi:excisionase family DNA binding protein
MAKHATAGRLKVSEAATTAGQTYLRLPEVAERLRTPVATVRQWVWKGRLRAYKPGLHVLVAESDLAAFLASKVVVDLGANR